MSVENLNHKPSADHSVLDTSSKNKKSILSDKTFMIDIVDKVSCTKVEKLINVYGGKLVQSLEKNTDYLISDKINNERLLHKGGSDMNNCKKDIEVKNVPCSKRKNSTDLINKATVLNVQILSAKQFQHWLKSLLRKNRTKKKPTDQVASVLRGKVSLKIESMDQGQCPVFEFIPKWPDLGDTLFKKKTKIPTQHNFSGDNSDEYSSDQYSTSEIGGMCELCDMPFMNYKEHINTKKHMRESQDEIRFHELDELINERPLNVIFNQFVPNKKISENQELPAETSTIKNCIENTVITIIDSDSNDSELKNMPCSFSDKIPSNLKEQDCISLKRKCCSDTNISFVPQKRPSNIPLNEKFNRNKKIKRKHKTYQKPTSKDIYKVEVVNSLPSSSKSDLHNGRISSDKPPVIIRLKRIHNSKNLNLLSDIDSYGSISSDDCSKKSPEKDPVQDQRFIRVVRKPSFSNEGRHSSSKVYSKNQIFTFEQPEIRQRFHNSISYYPTYTCIPHTMSNVEYIQERMAQLGNNNFKCTFSFNESLKFLSNVEPRKIGEWFYNVPKKIQDDLSFDSNALVPLTQL